MSIPEVSKLALLWYVDVVRLLLQQITGSIERAKQQSMDLVIQGALVQEAINGAVVDQMVIFQLDDGEDNHLSFPCSLMA